MRSLQLYQALHELESMLAERRGQATSLLRVDTQHQTGMRDAADGSTELSRGSASFVQMLNSRAINCSCRPVGGP